MFCLILGSGVSNGVIIQRFPEKDWEDTPFIDGIEWVSMGFNLIWFQFHANSLISKVSLQQLNIVIHVFGSIQTFVMNDFSFVNLKDGLFLPRDKNLGSLSRYSQT